MIAAFAISHILVSAAIQRQYDRWSQAYVQNDVAVLLDILSPDYVLTSFTGKELSYAPYAASLKLRQEAGIQSATSYKTHINKLSMGAERASVISVEVMRTPDPKSRKITFHTHTYEDRWVLQGKKWRLKSTRTIDEKTEVR